ncbi:MAG TPA: DNA modification methylase [Terriglobales bacterium]|nr:DNA modification methylase [Terriglobales bacterium]
MPRVRIIPITQLILDEGNANNGTKRGRDLLGRSLEIYGAGRSVVVDRHNRVIAGNKTVEAARAAGMQSIAVVESDGTSLVAVQRGDLDLTRDKRARELAIADNRVSEIDLEWNPEVLSSLEVDLTQFWNENELKTLLKDFRTTELSAPEPKIDQAAELQKKWKTKRGQIWEIGQHRLMCGDSGSSSDVTALMNGKAAKLCATDPPYLVSYDAKNHPSKDFSDGKNKDWKGRYADKQKTEPLGPFYEAFLKQALAVCEDDAGIYVWHASQRQVEVEKAMRNCGILVHQQIIWVKNKPVLTHSFYMWQHEPCFFGWKQGHKPKRNPGSFPTTVWQIDVPVLPGVESRHPTEKPLELFATPILLHTQPGDLCYEPFSGSGTHLCAAENTGRRCFAMEIEPAFVAVALERLSEMGLKPKLVSS